MTTLDTMMNDPLLGAGILLFVALCLGVGLFLLTSSCDAKHIEEAEQEWLRNRKLEAYRAHANWKHATRKGSRHAHRTKS
jgi:hypothetical protein